MEKYFVSKSMLDEINWKCTKRPHKVKPLFFTNLKSLYTFLKNNMQSLDDFQLSENSIYLSWYEKDGKEINYRTAKIVFDEDTMDSVYNRFLDIYTDYICYRDSHNFTKKRVSDTFESTSIFSDSDIEMIERYCKEVIESYRQCGRIDSLGDKRLDRKLINFLKGRKEQILSEKYHKKTEQKGESRTRDFLFGGSLGLIGSLIAKQVLNLPANFAFIFNIVFVVAGAVIRAGVKIVKANRQARKSIAEYEEYGNIIQDLIERYEYQIRNNFQNDSYDLNLFHELIEKDLAYMNNSENSFFGAYPLQIGQLYEFFKEEYTRGNADIAKYLIELAHMEIDIYSKSDGLGTKPNIACPIDKESILKRLELLGFDEDLISKDPFLTPLFETVTRITETPFVGCEGELSRLNRIAIEYASEVCQHMEQRETIAGKLDDIYEAVLAEQQVVAKRIERAKKYSELCALLDDMETHLKVDPKMNSTEMTGTPMSF